MSTLERAIAIAAEAHAGQTDKAGEPYLLHVMRVVLGVRGENERIVAALHDVVEDNPEEGRRIMVERWPDDILAAVDAMTHRKGEPYADYIERVAANPIARAVKLVDLADNTDRRRLPPEGEWDDGTKRRMAKYDRAFQRLYEVITADEPE